MPETSDPPEGAIALHDSLQSALDNTDLVISDLWGVLHDGIRLTSGAAEALEAARARNIATVFLTNAPRPRWQVRDHLLAMGLNPSLADLVLSSGALARDVVRERYHGARLYHMGPDSDQDTIDGLPIQQVSSMEAAEVILATDLDAMPLEDHRSHLADACARGVPLLCTNPDRLVHEGDRLILCAGAVGDLYEEMGGTTLWFGKPRPEALMACLDAAGLTGLAPGRVLMVGDSLRTDVAGARAAGMRSLMVCGGLHRDDVRPLDLFDQTGRAKRAFLDGAAFACHFPDATVRPDGMIHRLRW
ncbi:TIGR01459 family HAD-type hydrolase [Yunchengibacter salinarum]|uniref:TIGR01459 family HAD-type hydrolase n=1 Tax=Yunchengibacter salinarum TaxID=3133399 RepID=UPI0035B5C86F